MADIKHWTISEPYLHIKCGLGEAPYWEEATDTLRFVDIVKKKFHVIDLKEGPSSLRTINLEHAVSVTANIEGRNGKLIVGSKYGYAIMDRETGQQEMIKEVWDERDGEGFKEKMRSNDGAIDSSGRFWLGVMNDPLVSTFTDSGVVFRLDPDRTLHRMITHVTIPNGIGWSADDKTMYFTDTPTKTIARFDYDAATGSISNRRVHWRLEGEAEDAAPDGWAMDVEGCIWQAVFGAGKVLRVSPEGTVIGVVKLPTRCVTCPVFVGDELVVTSAMEEKPEEFPESTRYEGSVFRINVGVKGMQPNKWRG